MTIFYLVRHGDTGVRNRLSGRMSGVHLNEVGREQARRMAERFREIPVTALYSSPLERTRETAEAIGSVLKLEPRILEEITEVDFGDWTGMSFEDLAAKPEWQRFNGFRTLARIPGGETMLELQSRFVGCMERIRRQQPDEKVVMVSHQEPIKTAITFYAGMHLDMLNRFNINPASVTAINVDDDHACVLTLNNFPIADL